LSDGEVRYARNGGVPKVDPLLDDPRDRVVGVPSGTVTFLFTDIEGSTGWWESAPEAMRSALARHDSILRSTIERHGGYVFATGGDGFAATFARAGVMNFRC
jgi:class 3 adenylate cyclase